MFPETPSDPELLGFSVYQQCQCCFNMWGGFFKGILESIKMALPSKMFQFRCGKETLEPKNNVELGPGLWHILDLPWEVMCV